MSTSRKFGGENGGVAAGCLAWMAILLAACALLLAWSAYRRTGGRLIDLLPGARDDSEAYARNLGVRPGGSADGTPRSTGGAAASAAGGQSSEMSGSAEMPDIPRSTDAPPAGERPLQPPGSPPLGAGAGTNAPDGAGDADAARGDRAARNERTARDDRAEGRTAERTTADSAPGDPSGAAPGPFGRGQREAARRAVLSEAEARLMGRRAEVEAQGDLASVRQEVEAVRRDLARAFTDASTAAHQRWKSLDDQLDRLDTDLHRGGTQALAALDQVVARLHGAAGMNAAPH